MFRVCFQRITHLGTAMENEPVTLREILPSLSWARRSSQWEFPEDPCMVYYKWSALGISGHMQGLKTPLHRGCGPHPGGGDKSLPAGVGPKKKTSKLRKHLFERRFDNMCAANAHNTIK